MKYSEFSFVFFRISFVYFTSGCTCGPPTAFAVSSSRMFERCLVKPKLRAVICIDLSLQMFHKMISVTSESEYSLTFVSTEWWSCAITVCLTAQLVGLQSFLFTFPLTKLGSLPEVMVTLCVAPGRLCEELWASLVVTLLNGSVCANKLVLSFGLGEVLGELGV